MSLRSDLEAIINGMPPGSSVSLPVDWLCGLLSEAMAAGNEPDELLTLEQVAERVGRATSTLRTWCNTGKLEGAFRLNGRDWRVPSTGLQKFIEGQKNSPKTKNGGGRGKVEDLSSWRRSRPRRGPR